MRKCVSCGEEKVESSFRMHEGYLSRKCVACINIKRRATRAINADKHRTYDREYYLRPNRQAYHKDRYNLSKADEERRAATYGRIALWQERNKEKVAAHRAFNNAVSAGKIKRQPCVRCGTVDDVHGHHEDYSKPLDVMWLCREHHGERHREINEERRNG